MTQWGPWKLLPCGTLKHEHGCEISSRFVCEYNEIGGALQAAEVEDAMLMERDMRKLAEALLDIVAAKHARKVTA